MPLISSKCKHIAEHAIFVSRGWVGMEGWVVGVPLVESKISNFLFMFFVDIDSMFKIFKK